jgi:uncharacterized protein YbjT (DUF2867 family)
VPDEGAVLVTGPTGTVGASLLAHLRQRGVRAVAGVHTPRDGLGDGVVVDFERPSTFPAALTGVDRVFLLRPPAVSDTRRYIRPFIRAAQEHGVRHVVFLSVMGVNRLLPHWRVEQDLRASGMTWTFLRPSYFAQNLETAFRTDIRDHGLLRLAAGRGRTSFVDTRDVAEVAALALTDPAVHAGRVHTLTGPAALTWDEVASILSAELGRPVHHEPVGPLTRRRELRRAGYPPDYVAVQLVIDTVARLGLAARVTPAIEQLLHRPATPLTRYVHDRREAWRVP